ncbi:hypothetical protein SO802_029829 [Lithocarpus litseifolius]|uniref:Protein FAR1-RELATED SEQUENCE n=1 Tax=Lithocarpus litseifolius TaxID=425828 RepID=A0AAW2BXF2_9ROSI
MLRHVVELYTPRIFQMFQDEYMKIADCTIYKANKSNTITEYKVKYSQRIQEHLVKYEASTTTVECRCKKFSFIGILCAHALKVLKHKNVKRLPIQYVLERWTQDAKASSIKDYHGIDIKGNAQESIGKCYFHLSHNACEISTLVAENEIMYEHTKEYFEKLMRDLQEIRKKCHSNNMQSCIEVHGDVTADVLQGDSIHKIKTKPTVGHPKRSLKSALEKKNGKSRSKTTHAKKHGNGLQKIASEARQVESLGSLNKVTTTTSNVIQEEHHFGKSTK